MDRRLKNKRRTPFQVWFHDTVDEIMELAFDPDVCGFESVNALADAAGLSHATVTRACNHDTLNPQLQTLWKLCKAIKMDISLVKLNMPTAPALRLRRA